MDKAYKQEDNEEEKLFEAEYKVVEGDNIEEGRSEESMAEDMSEENKVEDYIAEVIEAEIVIAEANSPIVSFY